MDERLSPRYSHDKLENPSDADLVDVFEDLWSSFVFSPVDVLLSHPNGDVAAMTLLCSYFEALWSYLTGESSDRRSSEFFTKGFCKVFISDDTAGLEKAAGAIYKHIRCGLAYAGMPTHKVNYSRNGSKPFFLTFPELPDGSLNFDAPVQSIVVNPVLMYDGVKKHFKKYIGDLRASSNSEFIVPFRTAAHRSWGIGSGENVIALTKEQFLGNA